MSTPVFISYSSKDRAVVARLASDLTALGLTVWWDQWEIKVGDSLIGKIQQGIREAGWLCIALTPNSTRSAWVQKELEVALTRELEERRVLVLPLLLEPCQLPVFLADKAYADFTSSYEAGFAALVDRVAPRLDPTICSGLSSDDDARVESAARSIDARAVAPYINWLAARLASDSVAERRAAIVALNTIKPKGLVGYLALSAKDPSASLRMLSALCLEKLVTPASSQLLLELMQDNVSYVRASARDALKRSGRR